jgi:hypothetical protein
MLERSAMHDDLPHARTPVRAEDLAAQLRVARRNAVVLGMHFEGEEERWQVLRVVPQRLNDIGGFEDRTQAASELHL